MAEPSRFGSLQAVRIRAAKLDINGSPSPGASSGAVVDGVVMVKMTPELEEGDDFTLKNGQGGICQTYKDYDRIKRVQVELELCSLDAPLISILCGGTNIVDLAGPGVGNSIGYELSNYDDTPSYGACLELWTKAWDGSVAATPPFAGGTTQVYWHFVMPRVRLQVTDLTAENEFMRIPLKGYGDDNPRVTSNGPWDDWPADIVSRGGITNALGWFMDSTIPAVSTGDFSTVSGAAS